MRRIISERRALLYIVIMMNGESRKKKNARVRKLTGEGEGAS